MIEPKGEVRFPGNYPVARGDRLSEVIRRAGGLTPEAIPAPRCSCANRRACANRNPSTSLRSGSSTNWRRSRRRRTRNPPSKASFCSGRSTPRRRRAAW
ncbi:MAG: SLBB domain-containing protein [Gammaproteobacteria bacterium]|nr:SLBB domain-containing protein [Gammaproteobacteria bacterium]